jgi:hypothetical protein
LNNFVSHCASIVRNVAGVAIGAAVEVVRAADGLGERTAAVLSAAQHAARVIIGALTLAVWTNDLLRLGFDFGEKRNYFVSF